MHLDASPCFASFRRYLNLGLGLGSMLLAADPIAAATPGVIWLESEKPSGVNVSLKQEGVGHPEFLSDGQWLKIQIDADKVEKEMPAEGVLLSYSFQVSQATDYECWNRIGYEFVRSAFDWRLDDGPWKRVEPEALTTDLMELSFFTEVAWLKLGQLTLSQGDHVLQIRIPRSVDAKGKSSRVLYASDVFCFHAGDFHPNGKFQPGQDWRDDRDRAAAQTLFSLLEGQSGNQSVALQGLWEVCRHDEQMPGETAEPIPDTPIEPFWRGIEVPGDKNQLRPDLIFAHRLWYRTRVVVPESYAGQSFYLDFPQNNLNTSVRVNGQFCGFNKNPFARFQIDVSRAVHPGTNEVWVGIKDAWYAYATNPGDPLKLRKKFNLPVKYFSDGFQDLAYPIWDHPQSGLLATPRFVAAGTVYVADVFCQPSVASGQLRLDVALRNPAREPRGGELICEAVNQRSGAVEKRFAVRPFQIEAESEQSITLTERWTGAKLWWPDDPQLYRLRAVLRLAGNAVDVTETVFGFREWSSAGKHFILNGVRWHGWADTFTASDPEAWLAFYKDKNQTTMRFWGTQWKGMPPEQALDFFDHHGVTVRRSGMLDGQRIGYFAIENDPDLKALYDSPIKMQLMRNWRDQMLAQVRGERNHPSIQLWSLENEWLYINCINLYGGLMDPFEAEVQKVSDAVRGLDPTRLTMTDGGGANRDQSMPVHGNHYVWNNSVTVYPDLAYEANPKGGGRGRWVWDEQRPRFLGEDYFIAGHHPELSALGGEAVFAGKAASLPAAGLMARILTEGYRWAEFGAFHFWMTQGDTDQSFYHSFAPRAVFCRQWDGTFASGETVRRTLGIFNDTRFDDPITLRWALRVEGQRAAGASTTHAIQAGENEKFDLTLLMPRVKTRTEAELDLVLEVKSREVFRDTKAISILPRLVGDDVRSLTLLPDERDYPALRSLAAAGPSRLAVFDPDGAVRQWLTQAGIPCSALSDLEHLPEEGRVLVIGRDALDPLTSTSSALAAYVSAGRRLVVLEQRHPLRYQGLPCEMEAAENEGRVAFAEDLEHPALRGLRQKDFFTWPGDAVVYRRAYGKPARGAKSLVQCDDHLRHSALVEVPTGTGVMLLCQLVVGEKLSQSVVAERVLANLLDYAASYRLEHVPVVSVTANDSLLTRVLGDLGLVHEEAKDPAEAIGGSEKRTLLVSATPANLEQLASRRDALDAFFGRGGWIVVHGLAPDGLQVFNQLVEYEHMIRPFRRERVTFPPVKSRLTAGLTSGDVALYSSERIFPWQEGNYVADDTFSYVVDLDEVAPFASFPNDFALNIVNGMVSADAWKYIYNVPAPERPPLDLTLVFPRKQELVEWEWIGNTFYYPVTRVALFFDGLKDRAAVFETQPNNEPQTFGIQPPIRGTRLTLRMAGWEALPDKRAVTGLDNIRLQAWRTPEFFERVKPMLNIGAMVEYPRGAGGIVLCNVLFKETESPAANGAHKQAMLASILRNLKAPFSGGQSVIAGAPLDYVPIDLARYATQYRDEKGWFGDKRFTFAALPTGRQRMAGVPFEIYDFATSPVPTALMLAGPRVPNQVPEEILGISIGRKADALFFLHTMRLDRRRNRDDEKKNRHFETLRYVVHYADGEAREIPILAEEDIHEFRQKEPLAIPGAQIAWTHPYGGQDADYAVAYVKQWNNLRPEVEIASVDMMYGSDRRGVPVLLALTAATAPSKEAP